MPQYVCSTADCGRVFHRREHLSRHERRHTRSRPYTCHLCARAFGRSDVLKRHLDQHQKGFRTDRAAVACDRCHSRKSRCDGAEPCGYCVQNDEKCERVRPSVRRMSTATKSTSSSEDGSIADNLGDAPLSTDDRSNSSGQAPLHADPQTTVTQGLVSPSSTDQDAQHSSTHTESAASVLWDGSTMGVTEELPPSLDLSAGLDTPAYGYFPANLLDCGSLINFADMPDPDASTIFSDLPSIEGHSQAMRLDGRLRGNETPDFGYGPDGIDNDGINLQWTDIVPSPSVASLAASIAKKKAVNNYFKKFHPHWPILHKPTFSLDLAPAELVCSVVIIGTLLEGDLSQKPSVIHLHSWLIEALASKTMQAMIKWRTHPHAVGAKSAHLCTAQALFLNVVFAMYFADPSMIPQATSALETLITSLRETGYFRLEQISAQDDMSTLETLRWITREQKKRLIFCTLRLDTYMSLLRDQPPSIRFQELCLPLHCTDSLWNTASLEEWFRLKALEPAARMEKNFSTIVAIALSTTKRVNLPPLLDEDLELGMCTMQSRLWEEVRLCHEIRGSGGLDDADDADLGYGVSWAVQLERWRATVADNHARNPLCMAHPPPPEQQRVRANAMMIYHCSYVHIFADLDLFRRLLDCLGGGVAPSLVRHKEARVAAWARSAPAMVRLYDRETAALALRNELTADPVALIGLYRAALVLWAYARTSLACDMCREWLMDDADARGGSPGTRPPPPIVVELLDLEHDAEAPAFRAWVDDGGAAALGGVLVCACNLGLLLDNVRLSMQRTTLGCGITKQFVGALGDLKLHR